MPCPHCHRNKYHGGFCCDGCHAAYMKIQHEKWDRTHGFGGRTYQRTYVFDVWPPRIEWSSGKHRSPDYTVATDEAIGGWSILVRCLEECEYR